jgi:two-component sensor histidine kinase
MTCRVRVEREVDNRDMNEVLKESLARVQALAQRMRELEARVAKEEE